METDFGDGRSVEKVIDYDIVEVCNLYVFFF
jgi:hypothetical protein